MGLDFRVLGPLEVARDGQPLRLGGPKQRALLALLLLEAGEHVPTERIVEEVWQGGRGGSARSVQVYVSELRKVLGDPERIHGEAGGYLLAAGPEEIDASRFEQRVHEGRRLRVSGEPGCAAVELRAALDVWRGAPLADLAYESLAQAEIARLEELRLDAAEELIEAELALGRHREVLPEIEALVAAEPLRERPRRQLMLALYRCSRQAEALDAYRDARRTFVDELGIEPGAELKELEGAILRQERSLLVEPAEIRARRRLPAPPTELVGRRREIDEVVGLLQNGSRLVTLTGPGGTGKTRLALQAAHELAERFEDGVVFVGLAALRDPELVPDQIAGVLGVEVRDRAPLAEVAKHLRGRRTLLLVDNFEQVDQAAPALASLLGDAPALKLLVTSRHPLRVYGEHELPVAPLALEEEAMPLFLQRARATGRPVDASDDVRDICSRLDCLPLAIELAAARARELAPAEMRAMLASRLDLASEGPRDLPARQQTLRATIEWSYELLDESERRLFTELGVFAGGCTAEAATDVCDGTPEALASLVHKSLLVEQEGRLSMLETIREYALEQLGTEHDEVGVRRRHGDYYVELGAEAKPKLKGADAGAWLERLQAEHDNFRSALDWAREHEPDRFLHLVDDLFLFWYTRGHYREGLGWCDAARTVAGADARKRAEVLKLGAGFAYTCREFTLARSMGDEALSLYRGLGDIPNSARTLTLLGLVACREEEHAEAAECLDESLELARKSGDAEAVSFALTNLSYAALEAGDFERAQGASLEALELLRKSPPERVRASELGGALGNLGVAELFKGDVDHARTHLAESLSLRLPLQEAHGIASALTGLAAVASRDGAGRRAARLLGAADAVREQGDVELEPLDARLYDGTAEWARSALGDEEFTRALEEGRNLDLEEAAADALKSAPAECIE